MTNGNDDAAWDEIFAGLVPDETGRLTSLTPFADLAARFGRLESVSFPDERSPFEPVARLLAHCERLERERTERDHDANNALAGVQANVSLLEAILSEASPNTAFLEDSTPEQRAIFLQSLKHAVQATKKLAELLKGPAVSPKK